jgi:hypothetical protein
LPQPREHNPSFAPITQEKIAKAVLSFPSGSAGGPDGLHPQHLKDLIGPSAEKGSKDPLSSVTNIINVIGLGNIPSDVCPIFFGASLVALTKKDGGI